MTGPGDPSVFFQGTYRGTSQLPWENEALEFALSQLPPRDPYRVWSFFRFIENRPNEVDLLVLGDWGLYLIEIKSRPGRYFGDWGGRWLVTRGKSGRVFVKSPHEQNEPKAQKLAKMLRERPDGELTGLEIYVQSLVFLSAHPRELNLSGLHSNARSCLVTRDTFANAVRDDEYRRPAYATAQPRRRQMTSQTMNQVIERMRHADIGVTPQVPMLTDSHELVRQLERSAGDPEGYRDYAAFDRGLRAERRARVYWVFYKADQTEQARLERAAEREARLLDGLAQHPGILRFISFSSDAEHGPTLVFESFAGGEPLERYLEGRPKLSVEAAVGVLTQVAHALSHCHKNGVIHGNLNPRSVLVREQAGALEAKLRDFALASTESVQGTRHPTLLAGSSLAGYRAPELYGTPGAGSPRSDCFSLGCLAYRLLTGCEVASTTAELRPRLPLNPRKENPQLTETMAELVARATSLNPADRPESVAAWVEELLGALRVEGASQRGGVRSPLEAHANDRLSGRFLVERYLATGSTSRVLCVADEQNPNEKLVLKCSLEARWDAVLEQEARVLANFRDRRIVELKEKLTLGGRACLLLAFAGTETLGERMARRVLDPISSAELAKYGEDLLDALGSLERKNVQHRDIKPANIGVGTDASGRAYAVLFDFSLAGVEATHLDVGTQGYRDPLLPERGAWDAAADRWSAAMTLYEALAGDRPPVSATLGQPGSEVLPDSERLGPAQRAFFRRAFAARMEDRFRDADEMKQAWTACWVAPSSPALAHRSENPTMSMLRELQKHWEKSRRTEGSLVEMTTTALRATAFLSSFFRKLDRDESTPGEAARRAGIDELLAGDAECAELVIRCNILEPARVEDALRDLYALTSLARLEVPRLLPHLRFRVGGGPLLQRAQVVGLDPHAIVPNADRQVWSEMVERIVERVEEPLDDHSLKLRFQLWHALVHNPKRIIGPATLSLLNRIGSGDERHVDEVAAEIAAMYLGSRGDKRAGRLLHSGDAAPRTARGKAALAVGAKPSLDAVSDGRYRMRSFFGDVTSAVRQWFTRWGERPAESALGGSDGEDAQELAAERVPVFWIEGKAEDGLSVLLLQVAAWLRDERPSLALVYFDSARHFAEMVGGLGDFSAREGERVIAVVDDVFDVSDRERLHSDLHDALGSSRPPVALLTCGPVDERRRWELEFASELSIAKFTVPALTEVEMSEFAAWYGEQTGRPVDTTGLTKENTRLLWFMSELAQGKPLPEVARRVRLRLEQEGIYDEVRDMAAAWVLGVEAPVELVRDPRKLAALTEPGALGPLRLDFREGEAFARVPQANLLWMLYVAWFETERDLVDAWAKSLAKLLSLLLESPDRRARAAADALLKATWHTPRLRDGEGSVSCPNRATFVRAVYDAHLRQRGSPHPWTLPRWMELRATVKELALVPDPGEQALAFLERATVDDPAAPGAARWLWLYASRVQPERAPVMLEASRSYFRALPTHDEAINELAALCRWHRGGEPGELALACFDKEPSAPYAYRLLCSLASTEFAGAAATRAERLLTSGSNPDRDFVLLSTLVGANAGDLLAQALAFLDSGHPKLDHLLAILVGRYGGRRDVTERAVAWLSENPTHPRAPALARALLTHRERLPEDFERLVGWIESDPFGPASICRGWARHPREAQDWLARNPAHPLTPWLLAALVASAPADARARTRAMHWLAENLTSSHAHLVLGAAAHLDDKDGFSAADRERLGELGRSWLSSHLEHPAAPDLLRHPRYSADDLVLERLRKDPTDARLARLLAAHVGPGSRLLDPACSWLAQNSHRVESHALIVAFLDLETPPARSVEWARQWLSSNPSHSRAPHVHVALCRSSSGNANEHYEGAIAWFDGHREHAGGHHLLQGLVVAHGAEQEFWTRALDFVEACSDLAVASTVIGQLRDFGNPANRRMNLANPAFVERLAAVVRARPELGDSDDVALTMAWLSSKLPDANELAWKWIHENPAHPRLPDVAGAAILTNPGNAKWLELGERLLASETRLGPMVFRVMGALLHATRADARVVQRALLYAPYPNQRSHREFGIKIGRALVWHPQAAIRFLQRNSSSSRVRAVHCYCALGLHSLGEQAELFLDFADRDLAPGEIGLVFASAVDNRVCLYRHNTPSTDSLNERIARWLNANTGAPSFELVVDRLARSGDRSKAVAKAGLSKQVMAALSRPRPPRRKR